MGLNTYMQDRVTRGPRKAMTRQIPVQFLQYTGDNLEAMLAFLGEYGRNGALYYEESKDGQTVQNRYCIVRVEEGREWMRVGDYAVRHDLPWRKPYECVVVKKDRFEQVFVVPMGD